MLGDLPVRMEPGSGPVDTGFVTLAARSLSAVA
jgi:hypothetical protein